MPPQITTLLISQPRGSNPIAPAPPDDPWWVHRRCTGCSSSPQPGSSKTGMECHQCLSSSPASFPQIHLPCCGWSISRTVSDISESHQGLNAVIPRLQTQLLAVIFFVGFFFCFLGCVMLLLGSLLQPRVPGLGSCRKAMFQGRGHGLALGKRPPSPPSLSPLPWHGGHGGCVAACFGCGEQGSAGRPWSRAR